MKNKGFKRKCPITKCQQLLLLLSENFNLVPNSTFWCSIASSTCCGGIFTLFALFPPFAYLVWKSCAANARLFLTLSCSLTHFTKFTFKRFLFLSSFVQSTSVCVQKSGRKINRLMNCTDWRFLSKIGKIAFWSSLFSWMLMGSNFIFKAGRFVTHKWTSYKKLAQPINE